MDAAPNVLTEEESIRVNHCPRDLPEEERPYWDHQMELARAGDTMKFNAAVLAHSWWPGDDPILYPGDLIPLIITAIDNGIVPNMSGFELGAYGHANLLLFDIPCAPIPSPVIAYRRLNAVSKLPGLDEIDIDLVYDLLPVTLARFGREGMEFSEAEAGLMFAYEASEHNFARYAEACAEALEGVTAGEEALTIIKYRDNLIDFHSFEESFEYPDNVLFENPHSREDPLFVKLRRRMRVKAIEARREYAESSRRTFRAVVLAKVCATRWKDRAVHRLYAPGGRAALAAATRFEGNAERQRMA